MFLILMSACDAQKADLARGQAVPAFELENLSGQQVNVPEDFSGQVLLVAFWADWCPSCREELRDFESIYQAFKSQGLAVVSVNIDQDKQTIETFIHDLDLSYETLLDKKGLIAKKYSVNALPFALIVDRRGNLGPRFLGETPAKAIQQQVSLLLAAP